MDFKDLPKKSGIYQITCTANNKIYIGSSQNIYIRVRTHLLTLKKGCHHNRYLQRAFDKYGESCFKVYILELCDVTILEDRETAYLLSENPEYNLTTDASTMRGYKPTEEHKKKMSKIMKGRKVTDETRKKMSEAMKGNKHTLGYIFSKEHRQNLSEAMKGNKNGLSNKENKPNSKYYIIIYPDGKERIIKNLKKFCADNDLNYNCMNMVSSGRLKQHKNFKCKPYIN